MTILFLFRTSIFSWWLLMSYYSGLLLPDEGRSSSGVVSAFSVPSSSSSKHLSPPSSAAVSAPTTTDRMSREQQQPQDEEEQRSFLIDLGRQTFQRYFDFPLDDWQAEAGGAIVCNCNVLVGAPTGAGKTVVGEMALHHAIASTASTDKNEDAAASSSSIGIYTTPLKALSNQKYGEFRKIFPVEVGLSTGDVSIHKGAPITVMTTEVYRNIAAGRTSLYSTQETTTSTASPNADNVVVVLDEFHYMGVPGRGGVWEESIITSPKQTTQIVGLSATMSNAKNLASWMEFVTDRTTVLIQVPNSLRPVPLRFWFATNDGLFPLFRDPDAGPGAPKGLLGYRGDGGNGGIAATATTTDRGKQQRGNKKKRASSGGGFGGKSAIGADDDDNDQQVSKSNKLPRGLQVNPALKNAASRRLQRVDRAVERQKVRRQFGGGKRSWDDDNNDGDDEEFFGPTKQRNSSGRRQLHQYSKKKMSAREERKERERLLKRELRRSVPTLHSVMNRLDQKDLLPAIFFIFSRAGCDEAARVVTRYMQGPMRDQHANDNGMQELGEPRKGAGGRQRKRKTRQRASRKKAVLQDSNGRNFRSSSNYLSEDLLSSTIYEGSGKLLNEEDFADESSPLSADNWKYYEKAGLLNYAQVREVASRVSAFNDENDEIALEDDVVEQFLFGVGSHHAGMLPAHKSFVEILFQNQLMKVVFATETLAAGINMPAQTTVVCAMAKRGNGSSMNLLETSNLLQIAGRAGRRGMDKDGTCVIMATPFETHDDAAKILTDPIKPITSQFSPSYSLCVNLIERGEGNLDIAKQLVSKSFAMWEKRQVEEKVAEVVDTHGEGAVELLQLSAQEKFMNTLVEVLQTQVQQKSARFNVGKIQTLLDILTDREVLKKTSKSFLGASKMLELERTTLGYLEKEYSDIRKLSLFFDDDEDDNMTKALMSEDERDLLKQIDIQRKRTMDTQQEVRTHPFSAITAIANNIMAVESPQATRLARSLAAARIDPGDDRSNRQQLFSAEELCTFSKSAVVARRRSRKLAKANPRLDGDSLLAQMGKAKETAADDSCWDDFLSITKTLVACGCLKPGTPFSEELRLENETFEITPAGESVGLIAFENSLWVLAALGGAYDVVGASSRLDDFRSAMESFNDDGDWYNKDEEDKKDMSMGPRIPRPQEEAFELLSLLRSMTPSELAGYVSCLVADNSRGDGPSVVELFQSLTSIQQRVLQKSMLCLERLVEVQKHYSVNEDTICALDISNCEVVTAWASGCSWSEALEISGAPPGDLARTLSRVLDACRQLGSVPFKPVRRDDVENTMERESVCRGLDPQIRRLCREASHAINRYPVKDPLAYEVSDEVDYESDLKEEYEVDDVVEVQRSLDDKSEDITS